MHDIYRSICQHKNANVLFTKSAIKCEQVQHMPKLQIGYIWATQVTKLFFFPNYPQ